MPKGPSVLVSGGSEVRTKGLCSYLLVLVELQSWHMTRTDVHSARVLFVLVSAKELRSYPLVSQIATKGLRSYAVVLVELPWLYHARCAFRGDPLQG